MRILVLIHEFPPIGGGGGRVAQDISRGLAERGHEVYVVAPHMQGMAFHSQDAGVHLFRVPSLRRKAFVGDLPAMSGYLLAGFFAALRLARQIRPDVIHVHFAVPAGALAWALSKLTGIPYVLTSHLGDVPGGVPEKTERWFRWVYPFTPRIWRDATAVTAISGFTRQLALAHYPVNIQVIPNGINTHCNPAQMRVNAPPTILFAGRFVHQKDPLLIPEILSHLKDLNWRCTMIGDGPLDTDLRRKVGGLGMRDRFSFPGWRSQEDVAHHLQQSDILLLPSRVEGIPMIGLQSLAAGLAVVASDVGGVSELVEHAKNGFLHRAGDIPSFVESLRRLLADPGALLRARMASLEISQKFDLTQIVAHYENVLLEAAKKN